MYLSWSGSTRRFLAAKSKVIVFQGLDRYEKWSEKKENKRKERNGYEEYLDG